jgi:opacity protein-like surface antigen
MFNTLYNKLYITIKKLSPYAFGLLCFLLPFSEIQAQNSINMPYSIYGVGELRFNQFHQNMGMGGLSQAYRSNMFVNDVNPASYTATDSTSFIFDITSVTHFYQQKTNQVSQYSDYISLGNISISFPVTNWLAMGGGVKPYSLVGYSIRDFEEHPLAGRVSYLYEGSGGLNQVFIGTAINPFGGLSLGLNASYVFGSMAHEASVIADTVFMYRTNALHTGDARGWLLGLGAQYQIKFSENRQLTIGATYGQQNDLSFSTTETLRRRQPGVFAYDTITHRELENGTLSLPQYYGAGLFADINRNWAAGIDYQWQNWESFSLSRQQSQFNNSYNFAAGVQYSPTMETYSSFLHRMRYSAGFKYGQSYLSDDNNTLDEFGITFGLHIPVRIAGSGIKIGFEYSQRGSVDNNAMQENFYRINIGLHIYERWFVRRLFY